MNAVVTVAIGGIYERMSKITHPSIKAYAEKIGAEFVVIDRQQISQSTPHWEKFNIYTLLNKYERIIYIDTDIIVRDDTPNMFDIVPTTKLGMFNEAPFTDGRISAMEQACKTYGIIAKNWDGSYYNSGVMIISRIHKYLFKKPEVEEFNFYEQSYLNAMIAHYKELGELVIEDIHYQYNRMTCMDKYTGEERFTSYLIHYAGYPSLEYVLELIPRDLERWKSANGKYNYKRHILIRVFGGLGDQINSEPAIRYLKEQIYPNDDISIMTHFPRIFSHLKLPVFHHGKFKPTVDGGYYDINTLPGPETLQWRVVSNLLCHTVDYCSMAVLRRVLPVKDKQPKMEVTLEDVGNVLDVIGSNVNINDLVCVHPGRHWPSKTFPVDWWQKVIDGLHEAGLKVCLIGQEEVLEKTRGTLPVEVRDGMIDTRDLLDLGSLFALISQCKMVISNDSSPIHIAGAFDKPNIILIPSCKHPEHILPWRNGSQDHKAKALYKKLTLEDVSAQPTEVYGSLADKVKGDILDYIADPEDVIKTALEMCNGESK